MDVIKWLVVVLAGLVLLSCMGVDWLTGVVETVYVLGAGWAMFAARTLPKVRPAGGMLVSTVVYVGLLAIGAQFFLAWVYREVNRESARAWRIGWTLRGLMVVLLIFAAGTAAVGVVHQVTWLARSKEPMFKPLWSARERANRIKCASNLRQIGQGVLMYANDHGGTLPPDLKTVVRGEYDGMVLACPATDHDDGSWGHPEDRIRARWLPETVSYVYLGAGLRSTLPADVVVAYERPENHDGAGMNLLFNDGHVEWFDLNLAEQKLAESVEVVKRSRVRP